MLLAFSFVNVLKTLIMVFFIISALLLILVILLQEPKGGGLSAAFGGAGAETFGVQSGGVNKFTGILAAVFLFLAISYAAIRPEESMAPSDFDRTGIERPDSSTPPSDKDDDGG